MKKFSLLALGLVSTVSMAMGGRPSVGVQANQFDCTGPQNTTLNYSTTSKSGRPLMHIDYKGDKVELPGFPEVRTEATVMGTLVSVTDAHMAPVDGPTEHYSMILPRVTLKSAIQNEKFETFLIRTSVSGGLVAPGTAVIQFYDVAPVSCVASFVVS